MKTLQTPTQILPIPDNFVEFIKNIKPIHIAMHGRGTGKHMIVSKYRIGEMVEITTTK